MPLIIFLIGQTVAGVWWAANISAEVRALHEVDETRKNVIEEVYRLRADVQANLGNIQALQARMQRTEDRVDDLRITARGHGEAILKLDGSVFKVGPNGQSPGLSAPGQGQQ